MVDPAAPVERHDETPAHFSRHGWMRVRAAFSADEAAAMRAVVWRALGAVGIKDDDRSTWNAERPDHLQHVKRDPAFQAIGSARLLEAIDVLLEGQPCERPTHWGSPFVAFPSTHAWHVPSRGWHVDANYLSALSPPDGIRIHALFGDVAPRAGATLIVSGSHRLIHEHFRRDPPRADARAADCRRLLQRHPYIRDLHAEGDVAARTARFLGRAEEHDGIELQVIENAGLAGDVLLLHPLLLHVATSNNGHEPRFLLSGGIDLPSMWDGRLGMGR
jgi:ectoine hydroxylase-related dioxygenase (phytanoyl-CoA dioxygenase family)